MNIFHGNENAYESFSSQSCKQSEKGLQCPCLSASLFYMHMNLSALSLVNNLKKDYNAPAYLLPCFTYKAKV
jgi:hypothetical protein